jgi:hypothetical protein
MRELQQDDTVHNERAPQDIQDDTVHNERATQDIQDDNQDEISQNSRSRQNEDNNTNHNYYPVYFILFKFSHYFILNDFLSVIILHKF